MYHLFCTLKHCENRDWGLKAWKPELGKQHRRASRNGEDL